VYAWDIVPFPVPEVKEGGEEVDLFSHMLLNLQADSAYVVNIKVNLEMITFMQLSVRAKIRACMCPRLLTSIFSA
jgi:hypothetical protein